MPMSLKCMIGKWLHKGQISQEEYDVVIKKLDGHNKQIRADAIEEFRNKLFGKLVRLTLSMWNFKLFDDALQETYNELKEQNNE